MNASQVAVNCLGRMQKVAPRTGGGQRGGDLLADETGFTHAADDDAAGATIDQVHRLAEALIQPGRDGVEGAGFDVDDLAGVAELFGGRAGILGGHRQDPR